MKMTEREFAQIKAGKSQKTKPPREKEIQSNIRAYLEYHGWFVIRHYQTLGSFKGLSDLTAIRDGQTVYIEVKRPSGTQSEYQKDFQAEIERRGGVYVVARGIDDIKFLCEKAR